jgi:nucleoid DNA-binding protein
MKLSTLVTKVATENGITKKLARKVIESTFNGVTEAIQEDNGNILIPNFGRFATKVRKSRQGSNLNTGEKIQIPSKLKTVFSATSALKEKVEKVLE